MNSTGISPLASALLSPTDPRPSASTNSPAEANEPAESAVKASSGAVAVEATESTEANEPATESSGTVGRNINTFA